MITLRHWQPSLWLQCLVIAAGKMKIVLSQEIPGDSNPGGRVERHGTHSSHKYIKNTSKNGITLREHLSNTKEKTSNTGKDKKSLR